jgi:APA family basic amino acid/polyamine antiporter
MSSLARKQKAHQKTVALRRRLSLPLLVLYGIGVTIGAGIYVLIGSVAGHAGMHAPLAFVLAAIVMGLTVGSYAELCTRYPVAAGEAAYVKAAFGHRAFSTATGMLMIGSGVIAAATVAVGSIGCIAHFIDWPAPVVVAIVVVVLGLISAWGILESVLLAALFTIVEVAGLAIIIVAAARADLPVASAIMTLPTIQSGLWPGIAFASLLAFFAFTGFEDLTNMVEEAKAPERDVPLAMAITLVVTTLLYVVISAIAVSALPIDRLAASPSPLSLVYRELAGVSPAVISAIAIVATLNTIIAQMTMATRVVYGMAKLGNLPRVLGNVNRTTATPLVATIFVIVATLRLAGLTSFERLAELTSISTLVVFAMVNLALLKLRWGGAKPRPGVLTVPLVVPVLGLVSSLVLIVSALWI